MLPNTQVPPRRTSHYRPKPNYRSDDASRHANDLYSQLQPWIEAALMGRKRHRLTSPSSRAVARAADTILCDCAAVLAESPEWEGALMAAGFHNRGWPVDVELVRRCHEWSCGLMDRIMSEYRNRGASLR